jgi:hypothetical protein
MVVQRARCQRRRLDRAHACARRAIIDVECDPDAVAEKSDRAIAATVGVSHVTVNAVRAELEATGQIGQLEKTVGQDGKARRKPGRRSNGEALARSSILAEAKPGGPVALPAGSIGRGAPPLERLSPQVSRDPGKKFYGPGKPARRGMRFRRHPALCDWHGWRKPTPANSPAPVFRPSASTRSGLWSNCPLASN